MKLTIEYINKLKEIIKNAWLEKKKGYVKLKKTRN